jgi:hypothetical protein
VQVRQRFEAPDYGTTLRELFTQFAGQGRHFKPSPLAIPNRPPGVLMITNGRFAYFDLVVLKRP